MKTGINFQRCNISSSELHNKRDPKYIESVNASPNKKYSIFEDQTKNNQHREVSYLHNHTLKDCIAVLRERYKEKVGQAPQEEDRVREITDKKTGLKRTVTTAGWSPIREGVCPIKADTKIDDFFPFLTWMKEVMHLQILTIDLHNDEGYENPVTKERHYNRHAHLVFDWTDHETGKTVKLNKEDMREIQTQLAASLGMERGEAKEATNKAHLSADEQRLVSAEKRAVEAEKRAVEAEHNLAVLSLKQQEAFFADAKRLNVAVASVYPDHSIWPNEEAMYANAKAASRTIQQAKTTAELQNASAITQKVTKEINDNTKVRYDVAHQTKAEGITDEQLDAAIAAAYFKQTPMEYTISRMLNTIGTGASVFQSTHGNQAGKTQNQLRYEREQAEEDATAQIYKMGM